MDIFESPVGQKKIFFSENPTNFDRNRAITLFFWDINLDFRDSQRRENEPLLDESGNRVSQKPPRLSWSSKFNITFGILGLAYYMPDICEKNT